MTRRRRVGVGVLLCASVAALTLATFFGRSVMSIAMGAVCMLALAWAYVLVQDDKSAKP